MELSRDLENEMCRDLENMTCNKKLEEGLFSLEKRLTGDLMMVF